MEAPASPAAPALSALRGRPSPASPRTYRLAPLHGPQLGPQHHATPMELSAMSSTHDAGQFERECSKTSARGADRLAVASRRHQAVLDQLEADRRSRQANLERQTGTHQADLNRQVAATRDYLTTSQARTTELEQDEAERVADKRQALQRQTQAREEVDSNHQQTTRDLLDATEKADVAIAQSKSDTRAKLDFLKQHREALEAKLGEDLQWRADACLTFVDGVYSESTQRVLKAEAYRHSAAMTCERMGELAQASKTTAQQKVKLTEEKAAIRAAELSRECHQTQVQTDKAVKEQLQGSKTELQRARQYCERVREAMAQEAAEYADRIREVEREHRQHDLDWEMKRDTLEEQRKEVAKAGNQAVQDQEDRFQVRRKACEAELDAVERRLREVEQETRQRSEMILEQWVAGNAAAEQTARDLERDAEQALKEMRERVATGVQENSGQNDDLKKKGEASVEALERRANHAVDSTQPALEAARKADEQAAAEAMDELKRIRPEPGRISAEADADVDTTMQRAAAEEDRLQREADEFCNEAKARMKAAHDDEKRMKAQAAEAWSRLRKACHQLRLMNLHDFAQAIVDGEYSDPQTKERIAPPLGTGLPRLVIASYS